MHAHNARSQYPAVLLPQSGLGREQSKYGMDEFLEIKYVAMGLQYAPPPASSTVA
jgi:acyl-CoA reductase-like NAD-dependent aldehyde dehydrogenase